MNYFTQTERTFEWLDAFGSITPKEARSYLKIKNVRPCISNLRKQGYKISTNTETKKPGKVAKLFGAKPKRMTTYIFYQS